MTPSYLCYLVGGHNKWLELLLHTSLKLIFKFYSQLMQFLCILYERYVARWLFGLFLRSQSTRVIWKAKLSQWVLVYVGPPYYLAVDQGSAHTSKEMQINVEAVGTIQKPLFGILQNILFINTCTILKKGEQDVTCLSVENYGHLFVRSEYSTMVEWALLVMRWLLRWYKWAIRRQHLFAEFRYVCVYNNLFCTGCLCVIYIIMNAFISDYELDIWMKLLFCPTCAVTLRSLVFPSCGRLRKFIQHLNISPRRVPKRSPSRAPSFFKRVVKNNWLALFSNNYSTVVCRTWYEFMEVYSTVEKLAQFLQYCETFVQCDAFLFSSHSTYCKHNKCTARRGLQTLFLPNFYALYIFLV